jgi:hypothetical protein
MNVQFLPEARAELQDAVAYLNAEPQYSSFAG